MILDLFDKLIDRCIQLINHRREIHRSTFADFAVPAFEDFELLHKGYLETFQNYRSTIKSSEEPLTVSHPIFDTIRKDILFSKGQRLKFLEVARMTNNDKVGDFINSICDYFIRYDDDLVDEYQDSYLIENSDERAYLTKEYEGALVSGDVDEISWHAFRHFCGSRNAPRETLTLFLMLAFSLPINEKIKKSKALQALDDVVESIQHRYSSVIHNYSKLRKQMLK